MKPSEKSEDIEAVITALMGKDRRAVILSNKCMTCERGLVCRACNRSVENHSGPKMHEFVAFRDLVSIKEYGISGMCQACQDEVFGHED